MAIGKDTLSFRDKSGMKQEVTLGMSDYAEAADRGMTFRQHINSKYETAFGEADAFTQLCASANLLFNVEPNSGVQSPSLYSIFKPSGAQMGAGVQEVNPVQSRILFPAAVMAYVEENLARDRTSAVTSFRRMLAMSQTVASNRIEQPVIEYDRPGGPDGARARRRAQLAEPAVMMLLKASERSLAIPETPISVAISDELLRSTTLDMVGLALKRQAEVESYSRIGEDLLHILQGDADSGGFNTAALSQVKADTLDSTITAAGALTQTAYIKWLYTGLMYRRVNFIVTDIAGALAIENRTGRPDVQDDNSKDRIDTKMSIFYPDLVKDVEVYVVDSGMSWPANTLMGFDSRYAMVEFINSNASYDDVERWVMRRGTAFVSSFGSKVVRYFTDAFSVLSLTTS